MEHLVIRLAKPKEKKAWLKYDKHIQNRELNAKIAQRRAYVAIVDDKVVGILRYGLFLDEIAFVTHLYVNRRYRKLGIGKALMQRFEEDVKLKGHDRVMISTRSDEKAQGFYKHLGYEMIGEINLESTEYTEIFMSKAI